MSGAKVPTLPEVQALYRAVLYHKYHFIALWTEAYCRTFRVVGHVHGTGYNAVPAPKTLLAMDN